MRRLVLLALLLTLTAGWPACSAIVGKSLLVSGETINATGDLFLTTNNLIVPACNAHTLPKWETVCPAYKAFEQKFKASWPLATGLWYAARKANDPKLQDSAESAIKSLRGELDTYIAGGK